MRSVTAIGRWSSRHPWRALIVWVGFVVALLAVVVAAGLEELDNGAPREAGRGYDLIDQNQLYEGAHELALIRSERYEASDPEFRKAVAAVADGWSTLPGAVVTTPLSPDGAQLVSKDRHAALVVATLTEYVPPEALATPIETARAPGVDVAQTGDFEVGQAVEQVAEDDLQRAELLALPVTLLVLLLAFGALVAASVPVVVAFSAVIAAFGLLAPVSRIVPIDDATSTVVLLIGMAVGVDYSLFYVMRWREEHRRGASEHEALETTVRTTGRTVLVSGATVMIAMSGLYMVRTDVFSGIANGVILVVACAVVGAMTVLPALLELLGKKVNRGQLRFLPHLRTESEAGGFWTRIVSAVLRRPLLSLLLSGGLLVALALPALGLRTSLPDEDTFSSADEPVITTFAEIRDLFPGASEPALVVVTAAPGSEQALQTHAASFARAVVAKGLASPPVRTLTSANGLAVRLDLPLVGAGNNDESRAAIPEIRTLVASAFGSLDGAETAVTGSVAEDVDITAQMRGSLPYVVAFVLVFAFLLLLVAFRSIVVPLKAIVLNLLSVAASYGVLVLVFQHRWAEGTLDFNSNGTIISWLPLFLFVILFGLSMDYHVFILSRVREGVTTGMSTNDALKHGIGATAGVVTSAALVMVAVFSIFGTLSSLDTKQAGVGLAVAVLIDATIVRAVLLPSSMALLGEWNWYLPRWLEWLPRAVIEPTASARPPGSR